MNCVEWLCGDFWALSVGAVRTVQCGPHTTPQCGWSWRLVRIGSKFSYSNFEKVIWKISRICRILKKNVFQNSNSGEKQIGNSIDFSLHTFLIQLFQQYANSSFDMLPSCKENKKTWKPHFYWSNLSWKLYRDPSPELQNEKIDIEESICTKFCIYCKSWIIAFHK